MGSNITIRDIAKLAGVSPSTVSRALNGKGRMRPETRERIVKLAQELGFRPNPLAKGLATKVNHCIGVGIDARHLPLKRSFYGAVLEGIEEVLNHRGYHLVFSVLREGGIPRCVTEGRVDGLILMGTDISTKLVEEVRAELPVVLVDHHVPVPGVAVVVSDNVGGARRVVEHLLEHGYRRIAFLVETLSDPNFRERLEGYRLALESHGIPFDRSLVFEGGRRPDSVLRAMEGFLSLDDLPQAIFGANDNMVIEAVKILKEAGLRVPGDIAVAGFDDGDLAPHVDPPLTTAHVPRREMGRLAADLILRALKGGEIPPEPLVLETPLVIRASCGCTGS